MSLQVISDPEIQIKPSGLLINYIKNVSNLKGSHQDICRLKEYAKSCGSYTLSLNSIKCLRQHLKQDWNQSGTEKIYLHELLTGISVVLPQPVKVSRNPELEARVKKLKAQQYNREYRAMTKNVERARKFYPEDTIAYQINAMNKQLIAVAQFVFSVAAGFAFGFIGLELIVGNLDFGFRLLLGIMCSLTIALAEIYFLAKKLNEDYEEPPSLMSKKLHQE